MSADETRRCPACHARHSQPVGRVGGFVLNTCLLCRTLFTDHVPTPEEEQDYGAYYHAGNLEVPRFVHERLAQIVGQFDAYRRSNRWLDVGFGAGALMQAAAARGWKVLGTEVSRGAAEAAHAEGFEVVVGEVEDLELPEAAFDVVSMVEVLEHVPEPDALLGAAARLLQPGGALYLTTPHARGISARLLGTTWSAISPPEHLQLFSVRGLRAALARSRLIERRLQTHVVNPHELLAALRRVDLETRQASRVETSYRLNEALSSGRAGAVAKRVANAGLNALGLGDSLKVVATTAPGAASPVLAPQEDLEREQRP